MATAIITALSAVMEDVGAVSKRDRNTSQNFNFRGIDAVVNAVSPALRKHGVIVTPTIQSIEYGNVEVGQKRTPMGHVRVVVTYTFTAADGSDISVTVPGEAMDAGDKATAKAMSVAFRTALLQALCLPTDETDPDASTYERAPAEDPLKRAEGAIKSADSLTKLDAIVAWLSTVELTDEQSVHFDTITDKRRIELEA
jgi:hypothetical protein